MSVDRYLAGPEETERAGAALWQAVQAPLLICLGGDLGAGKTTLARGLLRAAGHLGPVPSPTYTLVEPYETRPPVHHLDLYRLADPEELEMLGLRDILAEAGIVIVEWPERGSGVLPAPELWLRLSAQPPGRRIDLEACSAAGEAVLARWVSVFDVS